MAHSAVQTHRSFKLMHKATEKLRRYNGKKNGSVSLKMDLPSHLLMMLRFYWHHVSPYLKQPLKKTTPKPVGTSNQSGLRPNPLKNQPTPPKKKRIFRPKMATMTFTPAPLTGVPPVTPGPAGSPGCIGSTVWVRQGLADGLGRPTALMITMVATMAAVGARGMKVGFGI